MNINRQRPFKSLTQLHSSLSEKLTKILTFIIKFCSVSNINSSKQNKKNILKMRTTLSFSFCFMLSICSILKSTIATPSHNYSDAVTKSLLYFEAQRSGRLPYNQRVTWRDNSGLTDGLEQGV